VINRVIGLSGDLVCKALIAGHLLQAAAGMKRPAMPL
jgi:hypothetical protein